MFCESWCELTIHRDHSHCEKQKSHKCGVWACVYACGMVGGRGYSAAEWGHIHAWGEKRPVLWGLQASGHQWDAHANSHTGRDSPQCSSITPLFWAIPFSLGWLGIISFLHKKLCKSFHPVRWVLGPLTRVDILICCRQFLSPTREASCMEKQMQAWWLKCRGHNKTSKVKSNLGNVLWICAYRSMFFCVPWMILDKLSHMTLRIRKRGKTIGPVCWWNSQHGSSLTLMGLMMYVTTEKPFHQDTETTTQI